MVEIKTCFLSVRDLTLLKCDNVISSSGNVKAIWTITSKLRAFAYMVGAGTLSLGAGF